MKRAGFTVVELMVSLAIGGIALTSIYAIGSATTRHFREQQRVSNTQTAVRVAMDQLKRDFQRAGYLGSPNALVTGESCVPPAGNTVAALVDYVDDVTTPPPTRVVSGGRPDPFATSAAIGESTFDSIVLMGNYSTSGEYALAATSDATNLRVARDWQSFRRDFNNWENDTYVPALFREAFVVGRKVRVHTQAELMHYANIASITATDPAVDPIVGLDVAVANCSVSGGWVSPLNSIKYEVQAADATTGEVHQSSSGTADRALINGPITVLRRYEVDGANRGNPLVDTNNVPIDRRSILDYVVSFNVRFRTSGGVPNGLAWPIAASNIVTTNPERLRSVIIDISARTPEQEPEMAVVLTAPMRSFVVFSDRLGAARVRSAHAEIFLPNVAYRKL